MIKAKQMCKCLKNAPLLMFDTLCKRTEQSLSPWATWRLSKRCYIPSQRRIQQNFNPTTRWTTSKEGQRNRPVNEVLRIYTFCSPGSEPVTPASKTSANTQFCFRNTAQYNGKAYSFQILSLKTFCSFSFSSHNNKIQ